MTNLRSIVIIVACGILAACGGTDAGGSDASTDTGGLCTDGEQQDCTTLENYPGKRVCQNGAWSDCVAVCSDGQQTPCTTVCDSKGSQTCANGQWGTCETPAEECNGKDDDCDGQTDEELGNNTCGVGQCAHDSPKCQNGVLMPCNPFEGASAELCDGLDNTCDGQTDEGLIQECGTACGKGIEKCVGGQWQDCSAPAVQAEVCDGKDNDCNGQTDDGISCSCTEPDAMACGTDEGECSPGVKNCVGGTWGPCGGAGFVDAVDESCNDMDDNCDGQTDEGLAQDCETACGTGKEVCDGGDWVNCTAPVPEDEVCDGVDNDCNGETDENQDADLLENNPECAMARQLDDATENEGPVVIEANLYPDGDVDWYELTAVEVGDLIPPCNFQYDPCYVLDVNLTGIPDGLDYDLTANAGDCDGTMGTFSSTDGTQTEGLQIVWTGTWLLDDSTPFFIQVKPKTTDFSCMAYSLSIDFWGICPDETTGLCPWDEDTTE